MLILLISGHPSVDKVMAAANMLADFAVRPARMQLLAVNSFKTELL